MPRATAWRAPRARSRAQLVRLPLTRANPVRRASIRRRPGQARRPTAKSAWRARIQPCKARMPRATAWRAPRARSRAHLGLAALRPALPVKKESFPRSKTRLRMRRAPNALQGRIRTWPGPLSASSVERGNITRTQLRVPQTAVMTVMRGNMQIHLATPTTMIAYRVLPVHIPIIMEISPSTTVQSVPRGHMGPLLGQFMCKIAKTAPRGGIKTRRERHQRKIASNVLRARTRVQLGRLPLTCARTVPPANTRMRRGRARATIAPSGPTPMPLAWTGRTSAWIARPTRIIQAKASLPSRLVRRAQSMRRRRRGALLQPRAGATPGMLDLTAARARLAWPITTSQTSEATNANPVPTTPTQATVPLPRITRTVCATRVKR